jgi:hypothetical protein
VTNRSLAGLEAVEEAAEESFLIGEVGEEEVGDLMEDEEGSEEEGSAVRQVVHQVVHHPMEGSPAEGSHHHNSNHHTVVARWASHHHLFNKEVDIKHMEGVPPDLRWAAHRQGIDDRLA